MWSWGDMWFQTLNTLGNTCYYTQNSGTRGCWLRFVLGCNPAHCALWRFCISCTWVFVLFCFGFFALAFETGKWRNCFLKPSVDLRTPFVFSSAALCFAHIHIYGVAEIAKTWAERMLLQRECINNKSDYSPNVGQAHNSYFQRGAEPSNQWCRLWRILSLSLIRQCGNVSQNKHLSLRNLQNKPSDEWS